MIIADSTLNIKNLRLVTASVENWHELGHYYYGLGVPKTVLNEIYDNTAYQTIEDKKNALFLYYLHNVPMASWRNVAGALYYREEKTALKAVAAFVIFTPTGESRSSAHRAYTRA